MLDWQYFILFAFQVTAIATHAISSSYKTQIFFNFFEKVNIRMNIIFALIKD